MTTNQGNHHGGQPGPQRHPWSELDQTEEVNLDDWNESSRRLVSHTWFSTARHQAAQPPPSSPTLHSPVGSVKSSIGDKGLFKTTSLRIFPTKKQRAKLNRWIDTTRWTYNQLVAWMKQKDLSEKCTKKNLRMVCVNQEALREGQKWVTEMFATPPYKI